jgi:hypothetical protein
MKPEKQRLIHDLMNDGGRDARRAETLLAGGRVLRHRRHVRQATRGLAVLGVAALAALCVQQWTTRKSSVVTVATKVSPSTAATAQIHRLSDEELLALFPDTPVGLATLSDGRKKLIFPRPGDEARFIRHL